MTEAPSLSRLLRAATAETHAALDRDVDIDRWFATSERALDYAALIETFDRRCADEVEGRPTTLASGRIARPGTGRVATLDDHEAVGALYVIEGSRLGGRLIAAELRRRADDEPALWPAEVVDRIVDTLDPYGPALPARWRRTLDAVDRSGADPAAVLRGATATFRLARELLVGESPRRTAHGPATIGGAR